MSQRKPADNVIAQIKVKLLGVTSRRSGGGCSSHSPAPAAASPMRFRGAVFVTLRKPGATAMCYVLCVMERVGVRELRQNLSVYLRRVKAGQRLEVTERGQPVARLEPVGPDDPLARLERQGRVVRRASGDLSKIRPLKLPLERPLSSIVKELREDRV
jgi:prevent-host-death family protein